MNNTHTSDAPLPHAPLIIAATFGIGGLAYSMHAASFLHPKAVIFAIGAFALSVLWARTRPGLAWTGVMAFLPLWLYLGLGAARSLAGMSPAADRTGEAVLMLAPTLAFASLAWPQLSYRFVQPVLLFGTVPVAALALAQYAGWADWLLPPVPTYTQAMYSVFGNQDLLGGFVAVGLVVAVQGALRREPPPGWFIAALAVLLPAWLLAGSRTAWLAGVIGIGVALVCMEIHSRRRMAWLGAAGFALALLIVWLSPIATIERVTGTFASDDEGGWLRLWFWDGTLRMIASAPVFGVGLGVFPFESPRFLGEAFLQTDWIQHKTTELAVLHAHSDPLEALAEMGLLGAALLGWMAWRLRKARGDAWGPLAVLLVFSCFNATVISPPHAVAGLMLMACLMREGETRSPTPSVRLSHAMPVVTGALAALAIGFLLVPSVQLRTAQTAHLDGEVDPERYLWVADTSFFRPEALVSLGQWHAEQQNWLEAIMAYEAALPNVDTGRIHLELGALYIRMGDLYTAQGYLEAATLRWPWNYDAWRLYLATLPDETFHENLERATGLLNEADAERLRAVFTPAS